MTRNIVLAIMASLVATGCVTTTTASSAHKSTTSVICDSRHERGRLAMIESMQLIDSCVKTKNRRSGACAMFSVKVDSLNFQIGQSTACTKAGYLPRYSDMLGLAEQLNAKANGAKGVFGL
jgi:hypothetical protein